MKCHGASVLGTLAQVQHKAGNVSSVQTRKAKEGLSLFSGQWLLQERGYRDRQTVKSKHHHTAGDLQCRHISNDPANVLVMTGEIAIKWVAETVLLPPIKSANLIPCE